MKWYNEAPEGLFFLTFIQCHKNMWIIMFDIQIWNNTKNSQVIETQHHFLVDPQKSKFQFGTETFADHT